MMGEVMLVRHLSTVIARNIYEKRIDLQLRKPALSAFLVHQFDRPHLIMSHHYASLHSRRLHSHIGGHGHIGGADIIHGHE